MSRAGFLGTISAVLVVALCAASAQADGREAPTAAPWDGDPLGHVRWEEGDRSAPQAAPFAGDPLQQRKYFAPNDPLFAQQWHLDNTNGYPDVNVVPAWQRGVTGSGVLIGIVDDSLQTTHPDLAPNYNPAHSWDFGQNDAIPDPVWSDDNHGTSVAGVAAGRGGNGVGVTGAAPEAGLAGLRIDFNNQTDAMFVNATLYHSSGTDTSIQVKNHSYGTSVPFIANTSQVNALVASSAAGTIHTFAAGNERSYHGYYIDVDNNGTLTEDVDYAIDADASKKATQNADESIAVAALGADGKLSPYSNFGACVFVTAPSNGALGKGIVTTDRTGSAGYNSGSDPIGNSDYTSAFGGTSSASPLVAGVMALGKQANPNLDVRMAKHLLAQTSQMVDATDANWVVNAAGFEFSDNYGFGLIDADAFTLAATQFSGVTPLVTETTGTISVGQAIGSTGATLMQQFSLDTPGALEEIEVRLNVSHTWRGDLEAFLVSPAGTGYRLFSRNYADSFNNIDWTFTSNAYWGESAVGDWALYLVDTWQGADDGIWNSFSVTARTGSLIAVPEPLTLAMLTMGGLALLRRRRA